MMYLVCIFVPPLYFAMRTRWGAFAFNAVVYGLSCWFWISVFTLFWTPELLWLLPWIPTWRLFLTAVLGLLAWPFCASHAIWSHRKASGRGYEIEATKMIE